ncbi:MAG: hypothetical protein K2I98_06220 [Prevotella sp.]|nr:hypothetical protein [Prevotella sp.]
MSEYIFYTTEGFTRAPDNNNIENCQLLGIADGKDSQEALDNLIRNNSWIVERGFELHKAICRELASTINTDAKLSFLTNLLDKYQLEEYSKWLKTIE